MSGKKYKDIDTIPYDSDRIFNCVRALGIRSSTDFEKQAKMHYIQKLEDELNEGKPFSDQPRQYTLTEILKHLSNTDPKDILFVFVMGVAHSARHACEITDEFITQRLNAAVGWHKFDRKFRDEKTIKRAIKYHYREVGRIMNDQHTPGGHYLNDWYQMRMDTYNALVNSAQFAEICKCRLTSSTAE